MAKQQTALEWALTHLIAEGYLDEKELLNRDTALNELCRTAFEVEKQQQKKVAEFWHGNKLPASVFNAYYNQTYNTEK